MEAARRVVSGGSLALICLWLLCLVAVRPERKLQRARRPVSERYFGRTAATELKRINDHDTEACAVEAVPCPPTAGSLTQAPLSKQVSRQGDEVGLLEGMPTSTMPPHSAQPLEIVEPRAEPDAPSCCCACCVQ